ncbi:MAG: glutamine--fructose-6-phosphate transaminase (isomerizing) [Oscillospiraceae bacterium]
MCGIVGYTGKNSAQDVIVKGLEKLEYRGYDSAGIAIIDDGCIKSAKFKGRLSVLSDYLATHPIKGSCGIGHTRWATHGVPSDENAHPHFNHDKSIAIIHNGIIENYIELKAMLTQKGYEFQSQTDTEVIAHLFDLYYDGDLLKTAFKVEGAIRGTYAILAIHKDNPDEFVAIRYESPLVVGYGDGENFVASDVPAMLEYTRKVAFLENGEIARVTPQAVEIYNHRHERIEKEITTITWSLDAATKGGYEHFMLKEIYEQPQGIKDTLNNRIDGKGYVRLDDIKLTDEDISDISKVYIIGCGTAYYAGCVGRYAIEKLAKIPVICDIASEFRYQDPFVDSKTLAIVVSQSGETADTLAALREAKGKGARIFAITNVVGSSIAREADDVFYTWAGPEVAVASTKAYTTQLSAFYLIALRFALSKGTITDRNYFELMDQLKQTSQLMEKMLEDTQDFKDIATHIKDKESLFYIGRGVDYYTAQEAALKLKEISYIHAESFAAGELKHGAIALIEKGTPVIAIATQPKLVEKMVSNVEEVKARGAYVIGIVTQSETLMDTVCDKIITIPKTDPLISPLLSVVCGQLIAYYTSCYKNLDVDKPRNLAKSVTVE